MHTVGSDAGYLAETARPDVVAAGRRARLRSGDTDHAAPARDVVRRAQDPATQSSRCCEATGWFGGAARPRGTGAGWADDFRVDVYPAVSDLRMEACHDAVVLLPGAVRRSTACSCRRRMPSRSVISIVSPMSLAACCLSLGPLRSSSALACQYPVRAYSGGNSARRSSSLPAA